MINKYPINTLGNLLFKHNNDYGLDPIKIANQRNEIPNLSIAIPYFEAKSTINLVLKYLFESLQSIKQENPQWKFEVLLIDDGSIGYPANKTLELNYLSQIKLFRHSSNKGRYATRNTAIRGAKYEFLLFLDADILINETILRYHLNNFSKGSSEGQNIITASIFNFVDILRVENNTNDLFLNTNDFRVKCKYQESWIGCEDDKKYVDQNFEILKQTNNLREWPESGFLGPWALSNMVLGGLFGFSTDLAKQVGGCDKLFSDYGFEETSLATKLIALQDAYVVPVLKNYAIHISDPSSTLSQKEKDYFFQKAHKLYFERYLNYDIKEATKEKI